MPLYNFCYFSILNILPWDFHVFHAHLMELHRKNWNFIGEKCPSVGCEGSLRQTLIPEESREGSHSQGIFGCVGIPGACKGWGGLAAAQTEFKCYCQHLEPDLNLQWRKAVQEHSSVPHKKGFQGSNPCFCAKWRWVPAADPAYGSPSPCLGWGNWVCRGHIWNCSWQIPSPASDLLPCTVCTGFSPASSRCWELIWPPWLIFLCRNRNQIPQENYEVWENLCLIRYRCSCSPWQCTVRVLLAFNIWWPWVTCTALAS